MVGDAGGTSSGPSLPFYPGTACTAASPVTLPPAGGFPFGKGQPGIGFAPGATPQQLVHPPATTTPALAKTDTGPGASCPAAPLSGSTEKRTKDKEGGKKTNEQTDPEKKFRKIVGTYVVKQLKKYLQNVCTATLFLQLEYSSVSRNAVCRARLRAKPISSTWPGSLHTLLWKKSRDGFS